MEDLAGGCGGFGLFRKLTTVELFLAGVYGGLAFGNIQDS
jgi:hypothetical protein